MDSLLDSIMIGVSSFPAFVVIFTLPIVLGQVIFHKRFSVIRTGISYAFLLYALCFFALVFLPLPKITQAANLSDYTAQFVPFRFVADIIKESSFDIGDISTYASIIFNKAILQVLFNILLTIPFGMVLRYCFHMSGKKVVICAFLLSLFVEIGQLTGLFFLYTGSYRLCDIDDLILNTFGGYLGYKLVCQVESYIPAIEAFDHSLIARRTQHTSSC